MKKLICLLVVVLIAVAVIPAISADTALNTTGGNPGTSELIYTVPDSYEVIIPERLNIDQEYYFTASKMNIRDEEAIYVVCDNYNDLRLTNAYNDAILATINADSNGNVGLFWKGDATSRIGMTATAFYDDDTPAGEYIGITTFNLSLGTKE